MANFPGAPLELRAMNITAPSLIAAGTSAVPKTYFGADYQCDFPANFFANPRMIHIFARGVYTVPSANLSSLNVGIDILAGGVTTLLTSVGSFVPVNTSGSKGWMLDIVANSQNGSKISIPCPTIVNGFTGFATVAVGSALSTANFSTLGATGSMDVDTTQAISLKIWAQWASTLLGSTSISCQIFNVLVSR